ncbi:MAG: insulinase family protein [Anaerolineaceae bacterium]|nr:insulinase family protein [Anaerolineaceae bacterium]
MSSLVETKLPNGLTVHLKEIHTAPLISHWVWYRVGLRNEIPGKTGLSHWVEHMQFKGTPQMPAGVLDKAISRDGGFWNAFTYLDWTAYFETMPADKIDLALNLESERMTESLFDLDEVESEGTVIISEREGNENEPLFRLGEAIQAAAFQRHPYRFEVIGEMEDLHTIQRDDLYNHYRAHYVPANAVLAMAGDFDSTEMLKKIAAHYNRIPAGQPPAPPEIQEALPAGEQRVEVSGPGETSYLTLAYRAPVAAARDFFALTVVDSLLSGPSGLNMFGGSGISNKTSRLYRALVEKELAVSINGALQATIDPYLYSLTATVHPGRSAADVLTALDEQIDRLQQSPVAEEEIRRAVKQARALFAYGSENITNQAFWLGYAEMFATYDWFTSYVQTLETITPADVQHAAQTWLQAGRRVTGIYTPNGRQEAFA